MSCRTVVWLSTFVFAGSACMGGTLAARYPRGESRSAIDRSVPVSHSGTIANLPAGTGDAAEQSTIAKSDLARAASFTAYSLTLSTGSGYSKRVRQYCDYVVFDDEGAILGAYRKRGQC